MAEADDGGCGVTSFSFLRRIPGEAEAVGFSLRMLGGLKIK
jgi:hypothetical protein